MANLILVAGGTGNLGQRIITALRQRKAQVRVLVRAETDRSKVAQLKQLGIQVALVNFSKPAEITRACEGVTCVVSALSGLREVIIDTQRVLLEAAVAAGVPRFIPSDFSLDFTHTTPGTNRNLDLRREFHTYLDKAPIQATTIFNGAFAELLTGDMPLLVFPLKRVLYWGSPDQHLDFTTMDNVAAYTASAALDATTPRFLRIAGSEVTPRELTTIATHVTGKNFKLFRTGGLRRLALLIKVARRVAPAKDELYPAWQGMQYMHNMVEGRGKLYPLDNARYPEIGWTSVRDVLEEYWKEIGKE